MEKKRLLLRYNTHRTGGGPVSGQEDEAFSDRNPIYIEFTPESIYYTDEELDFYTSDVMELCNFEVEDSIVGQRLHVVIVRYQDGDTFGTSHGNAEIVAVRKSGAEARRVQKSIENGTYKGYNPWEGYFSRLEHVEIHDFEVYEE